MTDVTEFLAEQKRLAEAATEGPWRVSSDEMAYDFDWPVESPECYIGCSPDDGVRAGFDPADAAFIAAARDSVPRMIAALETAAAEHPAAGYWLGGDPAVVYERDADGHLCLTCSDNSIADALDEWEFDPSLAGWESWPCPTIRAIEAALGGENDGE